MRYGLVGEKLGHSFSKEIHEQLADYSYQLFSLNRQQFHQFFTQKDFAAVNVTIPYKQDVMAYLDHIDPRALAIGAVNTVVNRDGKLYGYNTDFDGFMALLDFAGIDPKGKKVLVLGSGGTSKTASIASQYGDTIRAAQIASQIAEIDSKIANGKSDL
ncbi:MAG: shikimate dehydrogenase, partial [Oscillospiraceae bacterium]|nr:shikimate dehydrogenase [Oscillospiraceae bacterium]